MNCPNCNSKVKSNAEYSIHMNLKHRGKSYKDLYEFENKPINEFENKHINKAKENKKHESNFRKPKTNVDNRMD